MPRMARPALVVALAAAVLAAAPAAQARTPEGFFGVMWDRGVTGSQPGSRRSSGR